MFLAKIFFFFFLFCTFPFVACHDYGDFFFVPLREKSNIESGDVVYVKNIKDVDRFRKLRHLLISTTRHIVAV